MANSPGSDDRPIPPHGGYRDLKSYQMATIVYEATAAFCDRFIEKRSCTHDQMVQAARSGKQNVVEGNMASGTSRKTELKLIGIARTSLEELLQNFEDCLRQHGLPLWSKDDARAKAVRAMAYLPNRAYWAYRPRVRQGSPGEAANTINCLVHQTNYLLGHQLRQLDRRFLEEGGMTERLYRMRKKRQ